MLKKIIELKPGDVFLDTIGLPIEVKKVYEPKLHGIPSAPERVRVDFKSPRGHNMHQLFNLDRIVEVVNV
jgi:hypothetical protein